MLKEGDKAPEFSLRGEDGEKHELKHYRGNKVVFYFYPKDNTPGCTKEANSFNELVQELKKRKVVVFGVNADSVDSHKKFIAKNNLKFHLLSDPDKKVIKAYDAWKEKTIYGHTYEGVARMTYIIDEKGKIIKIFHRVNITNHAKEVMDFI